MGIENGFLAFCGGFVGGLFIFPSTVRWIAGIVSIFREMDSASKGERMSAIVATLCFHSGPWLLIGAGAVTFHIFVHLKPAWRTYLIAGASTAFLIMLAGSAYAILRRKTAAQNLAPLSKEEIHAKRERFIWMTTIFYSGTMSAFMIYTLWSSVGNSPGFMLFLVVACLGAGYVFSRFMWAWHGSQLEVREMQRKRDISKTGGKDSNSSTKV